MSEHENGDEPDEGPEMDTLLVFPAGADLSVFDDLERLFEIADQAMAKAGREAVEENDRLGIPSYGGKDGKIVVRYCKMPGRCDEAGAEGIRCESRPCETRPIASPVLHFLKGGAGVYSTSEKNWHPVRTGEPSWIGEIAPTLSASPARFRAHGW